MSPLTFALVVVIVLGVLLVLVTRRPSKPNTTSVAVAQGNLDAYAVLRPEEWSVVSRSSVSDPGTALIPKGAALVLRPVRKGAVLRADDVLELTNVAMPADPVAIDIAAEREALVSVTKPGQRLTLYLARTPGTPSIQAIALSARGRDGSMVVAVSRADARTVAKALGAPRVMVEQPIR